MINGEDNGTTVGKIITFVHASGGVGATTLAVNAAAIIKAATKKEVCLMDMDLQLGAVAIHLDLQTYSPMMEFLNQPERLDRTMLEGLMLDHRSGIRVLTVPEIIPPVEMMTSEMVEKLLEITKEHYKYIVVDMPHTMTQWSDVVFKKSKVIFAVMQMNVPGIKQLKRWFSAIEQEGLKDLPIKVVVNRYNPFLGRVGENNITLAQASRALGRKIDFLIPNDHNLIWQSHDEGVPASSINPNSKFVRQMELMLHEVSDDIIIPEKRSFLGWEY
jgi:pilus assembly protein CpaE